MRRQSSQPSTEAGSSRTSTWSRWVQARLLIALLDGLRGEVLRGRTAPPSSPRRRRSRSAWSSPSARRRRRRRPGRSVSSRLAAPAASPVRRKPSSSRATASPSHSVHGRAPRKRKRNEKGSRSPSVSVTASRRPSSSVELGDLAAVADDDAVALELVDEVVGHRLAQVGAAVEKRDERAALGRARRRPARRSCRRRRRPPASRRRAAPRAGRRRRRRSVPRSRRDPSTGSRRYSAPVASRTARAAISCPSSSRTTWRPFPASSQRARYGVAVRASELARLGHRAAGQLGAADPGGKAEVVLDPAGGSGLAAERGALDHQRVEPFGGAVDRGGEPRRAGAHDQQVDLLARARARGPIPSARSTSPFDGWLSSPPPGSRTSGSAPPPGGDCVVPDVRQLVRPERSSSSCIVASEERGPTISTPIPCTLCSASRRAMNVESRRSLSGPSSNSKRAQRVRARPRCTAAAWSRPRSRKPSGPRGGSARRGTSRGRAG